MWVVEMGSDKLSAVEPQRQRRRLDHLGRQVVSAERPSEVACPGWREISQGAGGFGSGSPSQQVEAIVGVTMRYCLQQEARCPPPLNIIVA